MKSLRKGGEADMLIEDVAMVMGFKVLIASVQKGCLLFIPLLLVLKTGLTLLKGFTDPAVKVHYQPLLTGILVWLLIATYPEVMNHLNMLCESMIAFVAPPVKDPVAEIGAAILGRQLANSTHTNDLMKMAWNQIINGDLVNGTESAANAAAGAVVNSVKSTGEDWFAGLLSIFASIIRMMIETVRAVFLQFLIAVGPIAITFSLAEGFNHVARYWLQKLLSVYCWALTLNILDNVIILYYQQAALVPAVLQVNGHSSNASTPFFFDQIIVGGMYLIVPWLTSTYLGGMDAGHFLTNKMNVVSTLVTSVMSTAKSLIAGK